MKNRKMSACDSSGVEQPSISISLWCVPRVGRYPRAISGKLNLFILGGRNIAVLLNSNPTGRTQRQELRKMAARFLTIILISLSLAGKGQIPPNGYDSGMTKDTTSYNLSDNISYWSTIPNIDYHKKPQPKYDTVKALLWVSDTSLQTEVYDHLWQNGHQINDMTVTILPREIWQIRGYEVYEQQIIYGITSWAFKEYLDENKKPLKLFVGMEFKLK